MTAAQEEAMKEVRAIIALHFDAYIITTRSVNEVGNDSINSDWNGPISDILGMNRMTEIRIEHFVRSSFIRPPNQPLT